MLRSILSMTDTTGQVASKPEENFFHHSPQLMFPTLLSFALVLVISLHRSLQVILVIYVSTVHLTNV